MVRRWAALLGCVFTMAACGGDDGGSEEAETTSGATCAEGSTLTYETFGRAFMGAYCTSCHASSVGGANRQGAPSDHNFDTLDAIRETGAGHIDDAAAAGPEKTNASMPPSTHAAIPSDLERRRLGEWLACGMP